MSIKTNLVVFNASNQGMQVTAVVNHNSDWGNNKPSNNFNNVRIEAFKSLAQEEDIDSDADSALFQLTLSYDNGDQLTIKADMRKALETGGMQFGLGGSSQMNYRSYMIANGTSLLFAVFPNVTSQTWMQDTWDSIKNKQLCEIALPGSHDSGLSTLNYHTTFSTDDNTQTQSMKIADQLNNGARFFELRPMLWHDETKNHHFYLGHFTPEGDTGIELQGALGEKLADALNDIKKFIINNSYETVVLRFEQYRDIDNDGSDFSDKQKSDLRKLVIEILSPYLYTNNDPNCNLGYVVLQDMYNANQRIIAVFDDFSGHLDCTTGIFSYGDNNSSKNYRLLDDYANTDNFIDMMQDQLDKFDNFESSAASMFLLSWTLTMHSTDFADNSIANLAQTANKFLWFGMFMMFQRNLVNNSKIPNIIYVDFVDSKYYLAEAAVCLNSFATYD